MKFWYQPFSIFALLLLPFSYLFRLIVSIRYFLYQKGFKKVFHFRVPIIIVGNITVGGTGKTPLVIWLANFLKKNGWRPGIISRGYGDKKHYLPYLVKDADDPNITGDEAILIRKLTACPVMLCIDRVKGVQELLNKTNCNVVISDDGLQHYRLGRHIEIAMIDGERQCGNGFLLPAGPLREPVKRLNKVDFVIENALSVVPRLVRGIQNGCDVALDPADKPRDDGLSRHTGELFRMQLIGSECISLQDPSKKIPLNHFQNQKVHAIAGIGNPDRFFNSLRELHIDIIPHVFPDHYLYQASDLQFNDNLPVLMTEKDAVKCFRFSVARWWYVPVSVDINPSFGEKFLGVLHSCESSF